MGLSCRVWSNAGAKARAEQEFASARTQQEAERAEQAIKDTAAALKEVLRLKVTPSSWISRIFAEAQALGIYTVNDVLSLCTSVVVLQP